MARGDVLQRAECAAGICGCDGRGASQEPGGLLGAVAVHECGAFTGCNGFRRRVDQPTFHIEEQVVQRFFRRLGLGRCHAERWRHFCQVWRVGLAASVGFAHPLKASAVDVEQLLIVRTADSAHGANLADGGDVHRQAGDLALDDLGQRKATSGAGRGDGLRSAGFAAIAALGFQLLCSSRCLLLALMVVGCAHPVEEGVTVFSRFLALAFLTARLTSARARQLGFHLFQLGFHFAQAVNVGVDLCQLGIECFSRCAGLHRFDAGVVGLLVFVEGRGDLVQGIGHRLDAGFFALFVRAESLGLGRECGHVSGHHGENCVCFTHGGSFLGCEGTEQPVSRLHCHGGRIRRITPHFSHPHDA